MKKPSQTHIQIPGLWQELLKRMLKRCWLVSVRMELMESEKGKAGPSSVSGGEKSYAGKIAVFFTGGTDPSKEMHVEIAKAGVGTIVTMHMPEDTIKEMKKRHINVINTGHMSSDSIGANLFFDELEKKGIEVISCSGLIRVK